MTLSTVSIGMTVFNAEAYLGQTLESLASQTFQNIEFCISDNASTDSSEEICRDFAQRDSRVRYFRQTANQGSIRNWNNALNMATGDYFMWASDHDLWDPTSVEQYVGHLDSCSSTALVHSDARMIDSNGLEVASPADTSIKTVDESRTEGFRRILWNLKRCNAIHGMFRRSILKKIGGFPLCWAMDVPLLTTTALYGAIHQLPEPLFIRRENRAASLSHNSNETRQFHLTQLDPIEPERFSGIENPYQTTCKAQLEMLKRAPLSSLTRKYLAWQVKMAYRARWNVRMAGWEFARRFIPKSIKRSRLVRS